MPTTSVEWQPDTWNSGLVNSATVWDASASPTGIAPPPAMAPAPTEEDGDRKLSVSQRRKLRAQQAAAAADARDHAHTLALRELEEAKKEIARLSAEMESEAQQEG